MLDNNGRESIPDQDSPDNIGPPTMIFALLNTKVTDIQCGAYHNLVVGTLRNSTAATMYGQNQFGSTGQGPLGGGRATMNNQFLGGSGYSGYSAYQSSINKTKQMVFSWGSNHNHQLGLFQLSKD